MQAVTAATPGGGPTVDAEALTVIATATRDRERVRFGYRARDGSESRRLVEPHSLVNLGRRWYLVAWDCDRRDVADLPHGPRRAARARPARASSRASCPAPPIAAEFVAENLRARRSATRRGSRSTPRPTSCATATRTGGASSSRSTTAQRVPDGDDSLEWLAMRICMLGVDFEVHEPPELVDALRRAPGPDRPRYSSNTMSTSVARASSTPAPARASETRWSRRVKVPAASASSTCRWRMMPTRYMATASRA